MAGRFGALKAQGLKHAERAGGTYGTESFWGVEAPSKAKNPWEKFGALKARVLSTPNGSQTGNPDGLDTGMDARYTVAWSALVAQCLSAASK